MMMVLCKSELNQEELLVLNDKERKDSLSGSLWKETKTTHSEERHTTTEEKRKSNDIL